MATGGPLYAKVHWFWDVFTSSAWLGGVLSWSRDCNSLPPRNTSQLWGLTPQKELLGMAVVCCSGLLGDAWSWHLPLRLSTPMEADKGPAWEGRPQQRARPAAF